VARIQEPNADVDLRRDEINGAMRRITPHHRRQATRPAASMIRPPKGGYASAISLSGLIGTVRDSATATLRQRLDRAMLFQHRGFEHSLALLRAREIRIFMRHSDTLS
jgi:hypothetical protein